MHTVTRKCAPENSVQDSALRATIIRIMQAMPTA